MQPAWAPQITQVKFPLRIANIHNWGRGDDFVDDLLAQLHDFHLRDAKRETYVRIVCCDNFLAWRSQLPHRSLIYSFAHSLISNQIFVQTYPPWHTKKVRPARQEATKWSSVASWRTPAHSKTTNATSKEIMVVWRRDMMVKVGGKWNVEMKWTDIPMKKCHCLVSQPQPKKVEGQKPAGSSLVLALRCMWSVEMRWQQTPPNTSKK